MRIAVARAPGAPNRTSNCLSTFVRNLAQTSLSAIPLIATTLICALAQGVRAQDAPLQSLQETLDAIARKPSYDDLRTYRGFYAEISYIGVDSQVSFPCNTAVQNFGYCGGAGASVHFVGSTNHVGLTFGRRLNPYVAIQLTGITPQNNAFNNQDATVAEAWTHLEHLWGVNSVLLLSWPVTSRFAVMGRAGLAYWSGSVSLVKADVPTLRAVSLGGWGTDYGVGLELIPWPGASVRVDYSRAALPRSDARTNLWYAGLRVPVVFHHPRPAQRP